MRLRPETTISQNYWVRKQKIPLGQSSERRLIITKKLRVPGKDILSDSIIISAKPGVGKSTLARNIIWFVSQVRPVIVFDWEGEDHKLSFKKNSIWENLPPYTEPCPVLNSHFFNYTTKLDSHERRIIPNLSKYSADELRALGFAPGAAIRLHMIIDRYKPFKDIDDLFDWIYNFPSNDREAKRIYKESDHRKKHYIEGDYLQPQTKNSLINYLYKIKDEKLFTLNNKLELDIVGLVRQNQNIFLNFKGEVDVARVELAKIYSDVIKYRKKEPGSPAPYFIIEEGDRLIPKNITDTEEKKKSQYPMLKLIESYKRARKLGLGQAFITPDLSNLHRTIIDLSFEKIFGPMEGESLNEVKRCAGLWVHERVSFLKWNRDDGVREFLYLNEGKQHFKFIPFACPQEMHRER